MSNNESVTCRLLSSHYEGSISSKVVGRGGAHLIVGVVDKVRVLQAVWPAEGTRIKDIHASHTDLL